VAAKNGKTPALILLRYLLHLGIIVIPKTAKKTRMIENLNVFNFKLSDEDIKILASLDTGKGGSWPYSMHEEFY
jgi:diketogulonate reductase-like aldo/keto reductase